MVQASINARLNDLRNYTNAAQGVEAGLRFQIHQALINSYGGPLPAGQLPDYARIQDPAQAGLRTNIEGIVNDAYSIDNSLHPLNGVINVPALAGNYFNQQMLQNLIFPHRDQVIAAIGEDNFMQTYERLANQGRAQLTQRLSFVAGSGIVSDYTSTPPGTELVDLKEFLKNQYGNEVHDIVDAVTEKTNLINAYGVHFTGLSGLQQVTPAMINQAILGRD